MAARNHPILRRLRELRRDPARREAEGVFVAEGIHLAGEALTAGAILEIVVVSPRLAVVPGGPELRAHLERAAPLVEVPDAALEAAQDARAPQPVTLIVRRPPHDLGRAVRGRAGVPLLVVACGVQDPGNLGSLLRSADAAGATGFVAAGGCADLFHPRAVRATMGSIFRLPCATASLEAAFSAVRAAGIVLVGTAPRGAPSHTAFEWRSPAAVVLGAEGAGLDDRALAACDARVAIAMTEGVESLSVAAAGAVILFEAARQRA